MGILKIPEASKRKRVLEERIIAKDNLLVMEVMERNEREIIEEAGKKQKIKEDSKKEIMNVIEE